MTGLIWWSVKCKHDWPQKDHVCLSFSVHIFVRVDVVENSEIRCNFLQNITKYTSDVFVWCKFFFAMYWFFFLSPLILICIIIFSSPVQDDIQLALRSFAFANWGLTQTANLGMTIKLVCVLFWMEKTFITSWKGLDHRRLHEFLLEWIEKKSHCRNSERKSSLS